MKFELTDEVKAEIAAFASEDPRREVCGLLILDSSGFYPLPLDNVSPQPEKSFLMRPSAVMPHQKDRTLFGYYHSHHDLPERPSEADIKVSEAWQLPAVIFSLLTGEFSVYEPKGYETPLLGRSFEFGIFDCLSLYADYYRLKLGILVEPIAREPKYLVAGMPDFHSIALNRGMVLVTGEPKLHDIICMSVCAPSGDCNHVAIYTGADRILHQLLYRTSEEVYYGGYWKKHTLAVYRHKSLL